MKMWQISVVALALTACSTPATQSTDDAMAADVAADDSAAVDVAQDVSAGTPSPVSVVLHKESGTFDVLRSGKPLFLGATADVSYRDAKGAQLLSMRGPCEHAMPAVDTLTCRADGLLLTLKLTTPSDAQHLVAAMTVTNERTDVVTIDKLTPLLMLTTDGASLQLASDPKDIRVLENGRMVVLDTSVMLAHGDDERPTLADVLPLDLRGASLSNWNHIVADPAHLDHSLVAGWLTFDLCMPTLGIGMDPAAKPDATGLRPFTTYAAENRYLFDGKPLQPGATLASELLWLEPFPADPLASVEQYALDVATQNHVVPWTKRGPGHPAPAGWNSWSGGGGTGGHGSDITEQLILDSLEIYRREFGSFGTNFFQVDDGWQVSHGDWTFRTDTFPHGGKWLAEQIVAAGFRPGLWFSPFLVDLDSQVMKDHPDWLQPKVPVVPDFLIGDKHTLDTSNPAMHAWSHQLGADLRTLGWQWLKVDFSYWAILGEHTYDPSKTHIEAWREAWKALRDGMDTGGETYVCGIGAMGLNTGRVEAMRLTADNGPEWDEGLPDDMLSVPRAFLPTIRAGARRWFYQNRIWQNHDDLIFFRSWPDASKKPVAFIESRAFATWIGLMSSIVKIGDKLTDMAQHPAWIDVVRRLTPIWPDGARPLDVLLKDEPEIFEQKIVAPAGVWTNIGLCNWGKNRDHSTAIPTDLPDNTTRTYTVHCPDDKPCAAYEFWSETYLGEQTSAFQVKVASHDCQVLALRPLETHPQLIGDSRHVTQGAADLGPMVWDAAQHSLSTTLTVAIGSPTVPWAYHLAYRVPNGFDCPAAAIDGLDVPVVLQHDGIADVVFAFPAAMAGKQANVRLLCQTK